MAYNVIMLPAAEDDYGEILLYFEKQFDSKQAIQTFVKDFGEVLSRLVENPNIYGYSRDEGLRQRGYHKFLIGKYVALFKIDEQKEIGRNLPYLSRLAELRKVSIINVCRYAICTAAIFLEVLLYRN